MSAPVMRMGLIGFSAEQEQYLANVLKAHSIKLPWQIWPFMEADALWVNGARAQLLRSGLVRIPAAEATSRGTQLNLKEIDRPVAFTLPLSGPDIQVPYSFNPLSTESVRTVLQKFEAWLQPVAAQLALAEAIAQKEGNLTSRVYHLMLRGTLVASLNLGADAIGLSPAAALGDFALAEWSGRPASASTVPEHFVRMRISETMWHYAVRATDDLLPQRYRVSSIHFRRSPKIPQRMLKDTHLVLLRELASASRTFGELQARTGLGDAALARALAALYFAGSITADPRRAATTRPARAQDSEESLPASTAMPSMLDDESRLRQVGATPPGDWTVPAPLPTRH